MSVAWIGTSGWSYPDWSGLFYPSELKPREFLAYYSRFFSSVELNSSFYRLPKPEPIAHWAESVPENFVFSVKASRYITHIKRLRDSQTHLPPLLSRLSGLGGKLGPILFQLPPRFPASLDLLAGFLAGLPEGYRYAFEFRDDSWHQAQVYRLLEQHNAAFCLYDFAGALAPKVLTSDWVYFRLHGPQKTPYIGHYTQRALESWGEAIEGWQAEGREVFGYFDNTAGGCAVEDALKLQNLLSIRRKPICR